MAGIELDPVVLLAAALVGGGILTLGLGFEALRGGRDEVMARLVPPGAREEPRQVERRGASEGRSAVAAMLRSIARFAAPRGDDATRLHLRLVRAGFRRDHAEHAFLAAKVALALGLPAGLLWLQATRAEPLPMLLPLAVGLAAVGLYAPNLWLSSRIEARQRTIGRALPDALDLLVTCVEAGLGLDAALVRVAGEMRLAAPTLAEELQLTFLEVRAGLPRVEAFRRLSERTGVEDLKHLSATLTQTEMFGTSIGLALRVQASGMRTRRMQLAEERAAKVAVKMTMPLVFCILPSLFAVVIGPAVVNITQTLFRNLR